MARPRKCRRICGLPKTTDFGPREPAPGLSPVVMAVDEYESIRLIDLEGLTQEEAAVRMNVARATIQNIYSTARTKLADCLVNGRRLRIEGGDVEICGGTGRCPHGGCRCPHKQG